MHISISSQTLFNIGSFPVTNTLITVWFAMFIIIAVAFVLNRQITTVPKRFQALFEIIFEKLIDFMEVFAGSRKTVVKFIPIVATVFFLILTSNWVGTLPGVESIGFHEVHDGHEVFVPLLRTGNSDINMTLALAVMVVALSHIVGVATLKKGHTDKYLVNPFKNPIGTFVGLLELMGEVSRVISLTFRLFGNIFAGSVLMLIISFLAPFILPIPFLGLELFVGFIQALVFAVLSMMFLASAVTPHEHEAEHH
jgi:F-type H+-transporting ATPase subunit a